MFNFHQKKCFCGAPPISIDRIKHCNVLPVPESQKCYPFFLILNQCSYYLEQVNKQNTDYLTCHAYLSLTPHRKSYHGLSNVVPKKKTKLQALGNGELLICFKKATHLKLSLGLRGCCSRPKVTRSAHILLITSSLLVLWTLQLCCTWIIFSVLQQHPFHAAATNFNSHVAVGTEYQWTLHCGLCISEHSQTSH